MKVVTERLPESQVVLQIEIEDERLAKAKESAYRRLASKTRIPGFRPGRAPRDVVERHLGPEAILYEAIDRLLPEVYREALELEAIDPVDQAVYELVTAEPLVAKFTVPVRPTVELGDYRSLRLPRETVQVDPERVQEGLEALRHRYATLEPVERPVQWGDIVTASVRGDVEGTKLVAEDDATFALVEGRVISLPGLAETLLGREKGETFDVTLTVPEDAPEQIRGKTAVYRIAIKELKQELLSDLDDAFAQQVGEGFPTLAALRERIESDLRQALEEEAEHRYHDEVLDALAERAELQFPPVIVEREVERLLREQAGLAAPGRGGQADDLEQYLRQIGRSEEDVRAELRPIAERRICRSLVLSEVAEAEHIEVTDEAVEAEIDRLSSGAGSQAEEVRRLFSSEAGRESLRRTLQSRKTLERLVQIASGGAEEAVADEAQVQTAHEG